jgi:predicted nuclease with RNAse H fold
LRSLPLSGPGCFETFPHAITWHLRGGQAQAAQKRLQRQELLEQAGLDLTPLTNIDLIDAALCALTAHVVAIGGECVSYGEPESGLIVVPRWLVAGVQR